MLIMLTGAAAATSDDVPWVKLVGAALGILLVIAALRAMFGRK